MKTGWMAAAGLLVATAVAASEGPNQTPLTDAEGKALATLVLCNDCRSGEGGDCRDGAVDGWLDGKPCGSCMVKRNSTVLIRYPFDVVVVGSLTTPDGAPVKERFVKLFLPNGWGVRSRTNEQGEFRLTLGATAERVSKEARMINLGSHIDTTRGEDPQFAIYMLPEGYTPCIAGDEPAKPAAAKSEKAGKGKSAKRKK